MADERRPHQPERDLANGQPLPPIPDGGLARAMPGWLRDAPFANAASLAKDESDPAAFLSEEDLPPWLRHLASGAPPPASDTTRSLLHLPPLTYSAASLSLYKYLYSARLYCRTTTLSEIHSYVFASKRVAFRREGSGKIWEY